VNHPKFVRSKLLLLTFQTSRTVLSVC